MKQTKFQNKGNNGKPTNNRHDDDDEQYEDKYAVEIEEVAPPKGAQDVDRSYEHYMVNHRIAEDGRVICNCKEIRRSIPK